MRYILLLVSLFFIIFANDEYELKELKNEKTKSSMQKWLDNDLSLKPYKTNYILPYGYSSKEYQSNIPTVEYKNIEAELQVSLQLHIGSNLIGLKEKYYISYSHQAFWQIYIDSAPFRESTYNPEAFVIIPIEHKGSMISLRSFKLALAHQSNGQPNTSEIYFDQNQSLGNLSRSVNYVYGSLRGQYNGLIVDLKAWAPLPENKEDSDNYDLMDYWGFSSLKLTYFIDEHMFTLMGRGNIGTQRGAIKATYSYPLVHNNFYVKLFSGYGESLIDYNSKLTKLSFGFSFSR
ncbi:phospholipase A [Sulfurimonas sp.]|jgi:phospholipase A1/A2|uniref:phospholipase A n=1 Tax=Sulfurimonas sp. TaxID=2022749 RepID=UPI0025E82889|nr:phospholipase A [Sulfurimonas sp.]MBT5934634.1 phospholipase A [Sulfurimonas sp.]